MPHTKTNSGEFANTLAAFRYRAARLRYTSFGILGIIILLLLGGATAFILAPQITLSDFYADIDIDKKLKDLDAEKTKIQESIFKRTVEFEKLQGPWRTALRSAYDIYTEALNTHATRTSNRPAPIAGASPDVDVYVSNAVATDKEAVIRLFRSITKPTILVQLANPPGIQDAFYDLKQENVEAVVTKILAAATIPIVSRPEEPKPDQQLYERSNLLDAARAALQQKKTEQGLAALLGKQNSEAKAEGGPQPNASRIGADVPLAQVLQTNLTRFGTIIMITFLVSILTPLYRYNIRLATYYDARADVLELFDSKLKSVGFLSLAAALTPTFDFGKAPDTPIEQIIRLAREFSDTKGSHGKSS